MSRLGELLVASGLLTPAQVEQGLRAQIMWGARLGTNLVELGYLDLDTLSAALGRLHHLPAALSRHFDKADPGLQARLPAELAERFAVVPIRASKTGHVVYASMNVIDAADQATISGLLGVETSALVPAIAAELRIRYHLERVYQLPRGSRFLRSRGKSIPPFPNFDVHAVSFEDSSDVGIPVPEEVRAAPTPAPSEDPAHHDDGYAEFAFLEESAAEASVDPDSEPAERRTYIRTIAEAAADTEGQSLARIALRRVANPGTAGTIAEAIRAIRRGPDRDGVADLVVSTLERFAPECNAALVLVARGDVAIGWKGFCRSGVIPEIAVPLDDDGLVPHVLEAAATMRASASELGAIDQLLHQSLGGGDGDLVVVPVAIAGRVMCAIALCTTAGADATTAESVATAAGAAFARLMRDASR